MKFIELFAGIGGFRYGLEKANSKFICVWANEIDKYACKIYRKNFGEGELYEGDITKLNAEKIPDFELLTAGFPCQTFSLAGKRKGFEDTRGTLFFEIVRICKARRPRYILLENVKGLLSHNSGQTFQTILKVLSEIGYDLQWQVLNSKNFGVPQNRERVFIVGHLREECRPEVFPIGEILKISYGSIKKEINYRNQKTVYNVNGISPTFRNGHGDGVRIICPSLNANDNRKQYSGQNRQFFLKTGMIRRLTPIECERLQGFPDNWTQGISDTQRYKCLGNAVTTNVITKIGTKLIIK